ncbi:protealysin inhibitor emfourin [Arthrobacter sp. NicSoilB8]|uniref:protealysin inhibitor emfourin n=1 Tax=Arthrobacter sp. NicSoilB8 TaxID=2830998 RepID=UPI001CC37878|nr:protealysin inhibitor emfourin [Arthrobacter sp. NicSoilB8]BCW71005.1 hypothetical protein NicSoilB8_20490 [Arthrobacter sp. NicSoilB8]
MKLTIRRGGGIAGIVARTELDASDLPPPDAEMFAAHMNRSGLREPGEPPAAVRRPDDQLYEVSWEESGRQDSRRYSEASLPEGVRQLLAWVDGRPERVESIEP